MTVAGGQVVPAKKSNVVIDAAEVGDGVKGLRKCRGCGYEEGIAVFKRNDNLCEGCLVSFGMFHKFTTQLAKDQMEESMAEKNICEPDMGDGVEGPLPIPRSVTDIAVEQGWERFKWTCMECENPNQNKPFWFMSGLTLCDHCLAVRIRGEVADAARVTAEQKAPEDLTWGDAMHLAPKYTPQYTGDIAALEARVDGLEDRLRDVRNNQVELDRKYYIAYGGGFPREMRKANHDPKP